MSQPRFNISNQEYTTKVIFYFFFLFVQFEYITPDYIGYTPFFRIIRILQHPLTLLAFEIYVVYLMRNKIVNGVFLFSSVFILFTILHHGNLSIALMNFERCFSIAVYYNILYKIDKRLFIKCVSDYWLMIILINTALTLLKPHGLLQFKSSFADIDKEYFFLGVSNQVMPFYYVAITLNYIRFRNSSMSSQRVIFMVMCMWGCELVYMSMTSMLGCAMFTFGLVFFGINLKSKFMSLKRRKRWSFLIASGLTAVAAVYYLIVFARIQNNFADLIERVLHKNATLSTRTIIWDEAFDMILRSIITGYGAADNNNRYIKLGTFSFNAHNLFLQLLLMGGIVLLLIFGYVFCISLASLIKCNDGRLKGIILTLLVTFFFTSMSEVYTLSLVFIVLFIPYISKDVLDIKLKDILKLKDYKVTLRINQK